MRLMVFVWILLTLSCKKEFNEQAGPERTEAATVYASNLAADGCEERIRLRADSLQNKFTDYKPSPSTLPLVQQALKDISFGQSRAVMLRFYETGNKAQLQCGWGSRQEVTEVEVLEIKPR